MLARSSSLSRLGRLVLFAHQLLLFFFCGLELAHLQTLLCGTLELLSSFLCLIMSGFLLPPASTTLLGQDEQEWVFQGRGPLVLFFIPLVALSLLPCLDDPSSSFSGGLHRRLIAPSATVGFSRVPLDLWRGLMLRNPT